MEPVTHVLTGLCLARTGFNRRTAYAAIAMAVAAELPDADMLWELRGPVEQFQHHRGITHTFLGVPFEAALVVGAVWVWHRWRGEHGSGFRARGSAQPVRWVWLYAGVLVALLSHLLLDYTNNYGIRPFYPFDAHWYAWSIVFIVDPVLLVLLGLALVMPWLFGLVGSEVGERRTKYRGRGWAVAALLGMAAWWGLRSVEHASAVQLAQAQSVIAPALVTPTAQTVQPASSPQQQSDEAEGVAPPDAPPDAPPTYLSAQRTLASPDPLTPFRWSAVTDFGPVYRRSEIDSLHGTLQANEILTPKPVQSAAMVAAAASSLGRAYIDWSPMPYIEAQPTADGGAVVSFRDPRFMGGWLAAHDRSVLVGTVREDSHWQVIAQSLDQKVEKQSKE